MNAMASKYTENHAKIFTSKYPENICQFILDAGDRFYHFYQFSRENPLYMYFITVSFRKDADPTYQTVQDIVSVFETYDPNATVLIRAEPYADGEGYHVHMLILSRARVNLVQAKQTMYAHGGGQFITYLEPMTRTVKNVHETMQYMYKLDKRPQIKRIVAKTELIMKTVIRFWENESREN